MTPPIAHAQPSDGDSVARAMDAFFAQKLPEYNVPGAGFALVMDGEIVHAGGYGLANVEENRPWDEETIFKGGSTIKLITAMAVLQLAEQGRVDLDADVNTYLTRFQVPETYAEPITLRQLLTHSAGLDAPFIGARVRSADQVQPLGDFLADHLPRRSMPPGRLRNYNDLSIALAAHVVEAVTGERYAGYVSEHIFGPLDMGSTSMLPVPGRETRTAMSYTPGSDGLVPIVPEGYFLNTGPGAAYNTTVTDLSHFIIAMLEQGRYGDVQLLQPETMADFHTVQFTHHPDLPGMAYTWDEIFWDGRRLLAKSGGAPGMQTRIVLYPAANMGFVVAYNRYLSGLHRDLTGALLDLYFPVEQEPRMEPVLDAAEAKSEQYEGTYREILNYADGSLEKVSTLPNQFEVTANEDGTLNLFGVRYRPVGNHRFQHPTDGSYVVFDTISDDGQEFGAITHFYVNRTPFLRVPRYETMGTQLGALAAGLITLLIAAAGALWLRHGWSAGLAVVVFAAALTFVIAFALLLGGVTGGGEPPWELIYPPSLKLRLILTLPLIAAGAAALLLLLTVFRWDELDTGARIVNGLVIAGMGPYLFFLHTWNLLGYRFN